MELPLDLRQALDEALAAYPPRSLAAAATDLSRRYRAQPPHSRDDALVDGADESLTHGGFVRSDVGAAAYAAFRLPATYAAVGAALRAAQARHPEWRPQTLLDVGAGPGTALWAACDLWPEMSEATLLERDERMIALGKRLATTAQLPAIRQARWRQVDITGAWDARGASGKIDPPRSSFDLVTAAYTLGELRAPDRAALVERLWRMTSGALVFIEPGTPVGFAHILAARDALRSQGATLLAPCPHDDDCPMAAEVTERRVGSDWCHFAQRLPRSKLHRQIKGGDLSYEDEKFSYVVASRLPRLPLAGRIVRHPLIRPGHISIEVCAPDGLRRETISKRDREAWRLARDIHWGDALPQAIALTNTRPDTRQREPGEEK